MFGNWFKRNGSNGIPGNGPVIELQKVVKKYQGAGGTVLALDDIDLKVNAAEFVAVLGKSGAGKTTLVNMLTGIDRPTSGEICVAGTSVHTLGEDQRAAWRGRYVGVVLQFFQLLPSLTVLQNVMLPMDFANRYSMRQQRALALQLLAQVGIAEHAHKLPSAVSGGQQQRIAIARALANDPPLLVADEPTGSLDSNTARSVLEIFQKLVDQGKTIVMVTHDRDLAKQAARIVRLADGRIVSE